jgi:hypothetical protein
MGAFGFAKAVVASPAEGTSGLSFELRVEI